MHDARPEDLSRKAGSKNESPVAQNTGAKSIGSLVRLQVVNNDNTHNKVLEKKEVNEDFEDVDESEIDGEERAHDKVNMIPNS